MGVIIRGTMFRNYLPEGFESSEKDDKKEGEEKKEDNKEEEKKEDAPVQVDTEGAMKSFMTEHSGNKSMMNNISSDTKAMIQNQKELMDMMKTVQPALTQGMEFMKAFKGMMGN